MSDEIQRLLNLTGAKVDAEKKTAHIQAVLADLKQGNSETIGSSTQGTHPSARQTTRPQRWKGNQVMTTSAKRSNARRYGLMSGVTLFIATVAVSSTFFLNQQNNNNIQASISDSSEIEPIILSIVPNEAPETASPLATDSEMLSSSIEYSDTATYSYGVVVPEPRLSRDLSPFIIEAAPANPIIETRITPVSTFSIDVDTATYSLVHRALDKGQWPNGAIRVEEMVNYFDYAYPKPKGDVPFETTLTLTPSPWNAQNQLLHIAVQGMEIEQEERPATNLVFLIDTSGSMNQPDKLPLLRRSFKLLLDQLDARDSVALVTYAGAAGIALEPTEASERETILAALDALTSGGSTAGAAGIESAYALAMQMQSEGSISRVILATDGDFNVGVSSPEALESLIAEKRQQGTFLSVLTFGQSHGGDARAQALAQNGNGVAANIDSLVEARKVLVEGALGQLVTIAKDVKIQVEFNPANVASYRLIGYETRALAREDFDNDQVDAGEIGVGHQVTAIYELTPTQTGVLDGGGELRYPQASASDEYSDEVAYLKMRYKDPEGEGSKLLEWAITADAVTDLKGEPAFAAAVAAFGQYLAQSHHLAAYDLDAISNLAFENLGDDAQGYRTEFLDLVRKAEALNLPLPLNVTPSD